MATPSSAPVATAPSATPATRVVLPRCAAWFSLDSISAVEKRLLPEFFEHEARHKAQFPPGAKLPSSKTPQVYMKYRNYMVHAYRQQPHVYLTATACRRSLAGDACAIMRVHEFLTHWGIINYDVPPHAMPPALHANYALKPSAPSVLATRARGADKPLAGTGPVDSAAVDDADFVCEHCGAGAIAFELSSEAKRKLGAPEAAPHNGYNKRDALPLQGFCLRPGSGVCDDCYLARSFPDGVDAGDFVRVAPKAAWTAQEDALLMDAVSSASSGSTGSQQEACDWNQIAGKVKTKSAEECIVRFLELPLLARVTGQQQDTTAAPPPTFAYAESANASVLDMAALVRDVDPFVAKAAARAAIQAIKELHKLPPKEIAKEVTPTPESGNVHTNGNAAHDAVKQEHSEAAPTSAAVVTPTTTAASTAAKGNAKSDDVEMGNGASETTSDDKAEIEAAAATVGAASEVAGIASIKNEPVEPLTPSATVQPTAASSSVVDTVATNGSSDDVEMVEADATPTAPTTSPVTKETLAVVQEASHATAAALIATRADKIATETAQGPMRDLVAQLLQNQLQQMELKMQQLSVLEKALVVEKESLTRERHALYMDRLAFAQQKLHGGNGNTAAL